MTLNQNNLIMTLIEQINNTFWKFILDKVININLFLEGLLFNILANIKYGIHNQ